MKHTSVEWSVVLVCFAVTYGGSFDDDLFFDWIEHIPSIIKFDGRWKYLFLHFESADIPDADLRELLALFYRYDVDMKQLAIFLNPGNSVWFYEQRPNYWHTKVFGEHKL